MKPAPFKYHDPQSLSELVDLTSMLEDAKILAGGQSLMPMMNMRFVTPEDVIDINKIEELNFIKLSDDAIDIGAMTVQRELLSSSSIQTIAPILNEALAYVGHFQTRNRGTIGGSLCHLDPAAELPALASLYDAQMVVHNKNGQRVIPFDEWSFAYMMPCLAPEDVLVSLSFPKWKLNHGYSFVEFARRHGDFAICAAGVLIELDKNDEISKVAITIAGADVKPIRLKAFELDIIGQKVNEDLIRSAVEEVKKIETMSDAYYSSSYRKRLAGTLVERALIKALERAGGPT
ncbi:MAG: xanthine dehydrogenase family protein subunit M [Rhodospirillales bacterium]|jgi:carbon-monoxide dehydrogenase medium subunit|nr:xanthine dehydrogenase family protein subunit M [Rhodospirillales bacterium]